MTDHMDGLLFKLRSTEEQLDERLYALENQLREQLALLQAEHAAASRAWVLPFVGLCVAVLSLGAWGYRQYRTISKLHKY
jgi:hypothetical protein